MEQKLRQNRFTLTDFLDQMGQLRNMGDLGELAAMIPGVDARALQNASVDEKAMPRLEAIILSMTPSERENPAIISSSRKRRIAQGCGQRVEDVNKLLRQFETMQKMVKQMAGRLPKGIGRGRGRRGGFSFFN